MSIAEQRIHAGGSSQCAEPHLQPFRLGQSVTFRKTQMD